MNKSTSNATKASRSAMWVYGQKIILMAFGLVATAILARRLSPAEYGLAALSNAILIFGLLPGRASIGSYVIYDRKDGWEERTQAAFWINMAMVIFSITLFILVLPIIKIYYKEPLLPMIMGANILRYAVEQFGTIPDALIRRNIDYYKLVIRDSVLQLVASGLSIWMALTGWGVWSLILPYLFIAPIQVLVVMWMARWKPTLSLHMRHWKDIFAYIGPLIGTNFWGIVLTNSDNFLVGTLMGSAALGIYDRAWRTSNLATDNVVAVVSDISMPFLSSLKNEPEKLQDAYLRMLRLLGITTFPMLIGLFVLADEFILTLYGPNWGSAVLPLRILLIYTMRRAIGSPATIVYNVTGKTDLALKLSLVATPIYIGSVIIGSRFGIVGVAVGVMLAKTIWGFVSMHYAGNLIGVSLRKMLLDELSPIKASIVMSIAILIARWALISIGITTPFILLLLCSLLGVVVYILLLMTRYTQLLDEALYFLDRLSPSLSKFLFSIFRRELSSKTQ
jgi:O-antigen/teichoic acid export membrane protein